MIPKILREYVWPLGWVALLAGLLRYLTQDAWDGWSKIPLGAGALLVLASFPFKLADLRAGWRKRSTRYGAHSAASVLLLVAILAMVNFLAQRHPKRWDTTHTKEFSLASQTVNLLEKLQQPVSIKAFYPGGDYGLLNDLLVEYRSRSRKLSFEFIDPDKQPQRAKQYEVTAYGVFTNPFTGTSLEYGTVVVESGARREKIEKQQEPIHEEDLTNAILKVLQTEKKHVCFVEGHGEKSLDNVERDGYNAAKQALEKENFQVRAVNLVRENGVPKDCSVLILGGPATEPFPEEIKMIQEYVNGGGNLMVLTDPAPSASLKSLLQPYGLEPADDVVLDVSGIGRLIGAGPIIPLVGRYEGHAITKGFNVMTFFPLARSIAEGKSLPPDVRVEKILQTTDQSWGETELQSGTVPTFDEKKDLRGPVSLGLAATRESKDDKGAVTKKSRIVAFGDSDFAANANFGQQGNGDLFLNSVNWLASEEERISIRPKDPEDRKVTLSARDSRWIRYGCLIFVPATPLVAGIVVWSRRRKSR